MDGMDMTGYRMVPAGQALMTPASSPWQPIEFARAFVMSVVMMIGMMTPSAAPMEIKKKMELAMQSTTNLGSLCLTSVWQSSNRSQWQRCAGVRRGPPTLPLEAEPGTGRSYGEAKVNHCI
jgi:predicted metal-binding membrane protein